MNYPDDLKYTEEHEWVKISDGRALIGITDFAQDALGDVVFVQLPEIGVSVLRSVGVAEVESTKSVSEIYAPLTGVIAEVNSALEDAPELLNQDPYGAGWIFVLEVGVEAEIGGLMDASAYQALVEG